jgi:hypothetical protein
MAEIPAHWLHEETLGPREVGRIFNVDTRTVTKWATEGTIGFFRTPAHMRRYPVCEVKRLMAGEAADPVIKELADQDNAKYKEKWQSGWRRPPKVTEVKDDAA